MKTETVINQVIMENDIQTGNDLLTAMEFFTDYPELQELILETETNDFSFETPAWN